jgi:glutaminyl-tRNA synthetase
MHKINFERDLWIEFANLMENALSNLFRLALGKDGAHGNPIRLRCADVILATGVEKAAAGNIAAVHAEYIPESKSGTLTRAHGAGRQISVREEYS